MRVDFTLIVLNYKTYNRTETFLVNLENVLGDFNIIIIDNDKPNKKFTQLSRKFYKDNYFFVSTGKNLGYSGGNNFGYKFGYEHDILGDYLVIINNDVEIPDTFLLDAKETIFDLPDFGAFSPKIIHKQTGRIQGPYKKDTLFKYVLEGFFPFLGYLRTILHQFYVKNIDKPTIVYRTMGSCFVMKSSIFKKIDGFDENVFLGSEEEILAEKLLQLDKFFYYVPSFSVIHDHGYTTKTVKSSIIDKYFIDSKLYYFRSYLNYNPFSLIVLKFFLKLRNFWLSLK